MMPMQWRSCGEIVMGQIEIITTRTEDYAAGESLIKYAVAFRAHAELHTAPEMPDNP